ncbi:MAG: hypothetical protein LV479_00725 [Methylacidiphilales bacterium]|nr:hypothetical protein [Candidatus Methylacidiphilales bacterium]
MQDFELRKLLSETHPVPPGQEERAWTHLRKRLAAPPARTDWLFFPTWRGLAVAAAVLVLAAGMGDYFLLPSRPLSFATANSQSPGIYATAFYSSSAKAQVVWLNGLDPSTDQPTYLDPTTVIPHTAKPVRTMGDPNSL